MASSKDQLVDDVSFIFEECARIFAMLKEGRLSDVPREDAFCHMPHPTYNWPNGIMMCGKAGFLRLERITGLALERANLRRLVLLEPARRIMAEILVRKFVKEKLPIEIKYVERAMSETARRCDVTRSDLTHFIPCHLMLAQQPSAFQIGPIRFLNRANFRQILASHIRTNRINGHTNMNARLISDATRYFKTFGWVAEVNIIGCDKKTSERAATKAVSAALDCLHVLFGAGYSKKMTVGGPGITYDKRGGFSVDPTGGLSYTMSYGGPGEVSFDDNWLDLFSNASAQESIARIGVVLQSSVDLSLRRPISERFLDAAQWFGEAVRETSQAAKVVKYVTALERMVMTDEKDDIVGLVSTRVAALCLEEPTLDNREKWRRNAKRAYDIRSKLVHGSLSPTSEIVFEGVRLGAELGRQSLLSVLRVIGEEGLGAENVSNKQLGHWYDRMVMHADRLIENAASNH